MIPANSSSGTASLVAWERFAATGAPTVSPTAHARLSIIVATTSGTPIRSDVSVMIAIAGMV